MCEMLFVQLGIVGKLFVCSLVTISGGLIAEAGAAPPTLALHPDSCPISANYIQRPNKNDPSLPNHVGCLHCIVHGILCQKFKPSDHLDGCPTPFLPREHFTDDHLDQVSHETLDMLYNFEQTFSLSSRGPKEKSTYPSSTTVIMTRKAWEHGQIEHMGEYMRAIEMLG